MQVRCSIWSACVVLHSAQYDHTALGTGHHDQDFAFVCAHYRASHERAAGRVVVGGLMKQN